MASPLGHRLRDSNQLGLSAAIIAADEPVSLLFRHEVLSDPRRPGAETGTKTGADSSESRDGETAPHPIRLTTPVLHWLCLLRAGVGRKDGEAGENPALTRNRDAPGAKSEHRRSRETRQRRGLRWVQDHPTGPP